MRVTFQSLPPPYDLWNGSQMWVGPTSLVSQSGSSTTPVPGFPDFNAATLQCTPFFTDFSALGTVHVLHEGIVPGGSYAIDVVNDACDPGDPTSFSTALAMTTAIWGDTLLDLSQTPPLPPEGSVNVSDALGILGRFSGVATAIGKARADLEPACVDLRINVSDVLSSLAGFSGLSYPFSPTALDPCDSTCVNVLP